ncbi:MAG: hypothetical protein Q4C54_07865 [Clostridia bacterium]|nr:hypothetical protein [Clostridia bacterium]
MEKKATRRRILRILGIITAVVLAVVVLGFAAVQVQQKLAEPPAYVDDGGYTGSSVSGGPVYSSANRYESGGDIILGDFALEADADNSSNSSYEGIMPEEGTPGRKVIYTAAL